MPDAAGIQRNNESNPKCESAVGVMGVPPLLCLPLVFLALSTLPSAVVSAPSVFFLQLHCLLSLFSAFCHPLTAHSCAMTTWRGSDVPHNDNEKPISIPLQFPGTPSTIFSAISAAAISFMEIRSVCSFSKHDPEYWCHCRRANCSQYLLEKH